MRKDPAQALQENVLQRIQKNYNTAAQREHASQRTRTQATNQDRTLDGYPLINVQPDGDCLWETLLGTIAMHAPEKLLTFIDICNESNVFSQIITPENIREAICFAKFSSISLVYNIFLAKRTFCAIIFE